MDSMTAPLQLRMREERQPVPTNVEREPSDLIFRLWAQRFQFRVVESVFFPTGKAGNVLRGALGPVLDSFEPKLAGRPSGFEEPPRPLVLRAAHLDGKCFE